MDKKSGRDLSDIEKKERNSRIFCRCLYEIENDLERTKFCSRPCRNQRVILSERKEENKKNSE